MASTNPRNLCYGWYSIPSQGCEKAKAIQGAPSVASTNPTNLCYGWYSIPSQGYGWYSIPSQGCEKAKTIQGAPPMPPNNPTHLHYGWYSIPGLETKLNILNIYYNIIMIPHPARTAAFSSDFSSSYEGVLLASPSSGSPNHSLPCASRQDAGRPC